VTASVFYSLIIVTWYDGIRPYSPSGEPWRDVGIEVLQKLRLK